VIATRFVPVLFSESFLGRENDKLTEELLTELPGILNWGIAGLRRLRERGRFVLPPSSLDVLARIAKKAAPVLNFVEDECELGPDYSVKRDELFDHYKAWCERSGHRPMSKSAFVTALEDADPTIKCRRPSAEDGSEKRRYVFFGIKRCGVGSPKVVPLRSGNQRAA
jgi:putative DNA primase/helicase